MAEPGEPRPAVLVYRDRIVPRSEAQFLRRLYIGFARLRPVWVGRRRDDGAGELEAEPLLLGGTGPRGALARALFKHAGILPPVPDFRTVRPRLVHAHFGRGGALALPLARALGVPLVVTFHGGDATKDTHYRRRPLPTIFQRRLPALLREAALFICVSESIRDRLIARGFPPEKLLVHRYGIEIDGPGPTVEETGEILFAGRFVEKKGAGLLIEAVRRLEAAGCGAHLVLIGDGPLAGALRRAAAPLAGAAFPGWLPHAELRQRMRGALAVCVPSIAAADGDAEGLPNVVLEAMAAGAPVVGSRHAGIAEAVEHGRTGLLVPPGDPQALAEALRALIENSELRRRLGAAGRARAAEHFDAIRQSQALETTLLRIIGEGSR